MMKIALFTKPSTVKVYFSLLLIIYIVVKPSYVNAGFFSDLISKVLGTGAQAAEVTPVDETAVVLNSQTLPLPESSINPDLNSIKDDPAAIISDEALLSNNGTLDTDSELEKYASTEKIDVYIVKKGDTIESIAKKLKVPQSTIIDSNADLKKSDLLKIGQQLVILAIKAPAEKKEVPKAAAVVKEEKKIEPEIVAKEETPPVVVPPVESPAINTPIVQIQEVQPTQPESTTPTGKPEGEINGGYIWPFPAGVGRVSQGLHADQAYDFAAPKGTPIYAVQSGTVLIAHPSGYNGGYGLYVVINFDDGRQAIFGHMSKVVATAGQVVKKGDIIGFVGSTGKSTGPHLHLGFHFESGSDLGNPYKGLKINSTDFVDNE